MTQDCLHFKMHRPEGQTIPNTHLESSAWQGDEHHRLMSPVLPTHFPLKSYDISLRQRYWYRFQAIENISLSEVCQSQPLIGPIKHGYSRANNLALSFST